MVRRKRSASFEKKYLYLDKDFFEELSFPVLLHLHFQMCMILFAIRISRLQAISKIFHFMKDDFLIIYVDLSAQTN